MWNYGKWESTWTQCAVQTHWDNEEKNDGFEKLNEIDQLLSLRGAIPLSRVETQFCYMTMNYQYVPNEAAAEVSRQETYRRDWFL